MLRRNRPGAKAKVSVLPFYANPRSKNTSDATRTVSTPSPTESLQ